VPEFAVTVTGRDRPGIIAEATTALAGLGANLTDSTMTLLRGHFAMTLVCACEVPVDRVRSALAELAGDGSLLVAVHEIPADGLTVAPGEPFVVTLHGADRLGLVAATTGLLAEVGGNITDATTRLAGELYLMVVEVDLPVGTDTTELAGRLAELGGRLAVEVGLRAADPDVL
jgi:glycine cleavage system transcriptional repressor